MLNVKFNKTVTKFSTISKKCILPMFFKIGVLKKFAKFLGNTCVPEYLLIKVRKMHIVTLWTPYVPDESLVNFRSRRPAS